MNIGVIGLGSIGCRHAKNLNELGHTVLGYDPAPLTMALPLVRLLTLDQVLRDSDAVVIASPTKHHATYIAACKKKMFVEKPIADAPILANPNVLMVGYNQRFNMVVTGTRALLRSKSRPQWATFVCAQYNNKPEYLRDGVILNWSHEIDLALHLLGPAEVMASSTRIENGKDVLTDILLRHQNGCRTTIHLDYLTNPELRGFHIQCEGEAISADLPARTLNGERFPGSYDEDYLDEMTAFIRRVEGKEAAGCHVNEAIAVLDICLKVRQQSGLT